MLPIALLAIGLAAVAYADTNLGGNLNATNYGIYNLSGLGIGTTNITAGQICFASGCQSVPYGGGTQQTNAAYVTQGTFGSAVSGSNNQYLFKPATNSTATLGVQNSSGGTVFNVDTTDGRVGVETASPGHTLSVAGDIEASGDIISDSGCMAINNGWNCGGDSFYVNGTSYLNGAATVAGTETVSGLATFTGGVTLGGTFNANNEPMENVFGNGGMSGFSGALDCTNHSCNRGIMGQGFSVTSTGYQMASPYNGAGIYFGNSDWIGFATLPLSNGTTFTESQLESNYTRLAVADSGVTVENGNFTDTGSANISGTVTTPSIDINNSNTVLSQYDSGGSLKIQTPSGWVSIGSENSSWAHFYTDRPSFYFSTNVAVAGSVSNYSNTWSLGSNGSANFSGTVTAAGFSGPLTGTESAANVSSGTFGSNTGGGNYTFPSGLTVGSLTTGGVTNTGSETIAGTLGVTGNANFSGTVGASSINLGNNWSWSSTGWPGSGGFSNSSGGNTTIGFSGSGSPQVSIEIDGAFIQSESGQTNTYAGASTFNGAVTANAGVTASGITDNGGLTVNSTGIFTGELYVNNNGTSGGSGSTGSIQLGDGTISKTYGTSFTMNSGLTLSGALSGTTASLSGALSGTTASFSGAISGTSGSFSGNVTASGVVTNRTPLWLNASGDCNHAIYNDYNTPCGHTSPTGSNDSEYVDYYNGLVFQEGYSNNSGYSVPSYFTSDGVLHLGSSETVAGTVTAPTLQMTGASGLTNSAGYQVIQGNATDWLRINQNNSFTNGTAMYGNVAMGTGGLSVGSWGTAGAGNINATGNGTFSGTVTASGFNSSGGATLGSTVTAAGFNSNGNISLHYNELTFDGQSGTTGSPGFYWDSGNYNYGIYRGAGSWSSPYTQLTEEWVTGIVLDPGYAYPRSYVNVPEGGMEITTGSGNPNFPIPSSLYVTANGGGSGGVDAIYATDNVAGGTAIYGDNSGGNGVMGGGSTGVNGDGTTYGVYGVGGTYGVYGYSYGGSYGIYCAGYNGALCGGNQPWTNSSDARLKTNITPVSPATALAKVEALQGVTFNWKSDPTGQLNLGFIAQQVKPIVPEVIGKDPNGYYTMEYAPLTALLTGAVQEQQKEIDSLKAEVTTLQQKLASK